MNNSEQILSEKQEQLIPKTDVVRSLSNEQIEMIADIFAKQQAMLLDESFGLEWIVGHAFQLGAKFYRDFTSCPQTGS